MMCTTLFRIIVCLLLTFSYNVLGISQPGTDSNNKRLERRSFMTGLGILPCVAFVSFQQPNAALADLNSAAASGVPLLGRFEQLKGAKSFIGSWHYEASKGIPEGELVFLKNGEVELRSSANEEPTTIIGVGAVPWKYVSPKGSDTTVTVTFTLDQDGQEDVLLFQGSLDSAGGPGRSMEGWIATGAAEIGARGSGPMTRVGSFSATFLN
eukprot:scaffold4838_cov58-Attheya_sp.AAC.1